MHLILNIFLLIFSLVKLSSSQSPPVTITYANCSSNYCLTCATQYLCSECSINEQPLCCPKYCVQCLDMNHCIQCENNFILKPINSNTMIVCTRPFNQTDPNSNQSSSSKCIKGFFLQPVTGSCMSCGVTNCQSCSAYDKCENCIQTYFPYQSPTNNSVNQTVFTTVCQPCIPNCAVCNNSISCTTCQSGYFATTSSCELCQTAYCTTCMNNGQTCTDCITGTYLNSSSNTCILCSYAISNCSICKITNALLNCTTCASSFYSKSSNVCSVCPPNCYNCQMVGSKTNCTNCADGYYYDNVTDNCQTCGIGCALCFSPNTSLIYCVNCSNGYTLMFNNQTNNTYCTICSYPCIQCTNDSTCSQCETGFYVNYVVSTTLQISQCYFCSIENCINCSSQNNCMLCEEGYFVKLYPSTSTYGCSPCSGQCSTCSVLNISMNAIPKCQKCLPGYTLNETQNYICIKCKVKNCMSCDSSNTSNCFQCNNGYSLSDISNSCDRCNINNCIVCNYSSDCSCQTCLQCNGSYYLSLNTQISTSKIFQCAPCAPNCLQCANQTYCIKCLQTFYTVLQSNNSVTCQPCSAECSTCNSNNGCLFCAEGYFPNVQQNVFSNQTVSVTCSLCSINLTGCVSCFNGIYCKLCDSSGYSELPSPQGNCVPCGFGCILCDNQQKCEVCSNDFLLNQQTNQCMDIAGLPAWGVFVIVTFGGALIFTLIEKIIRYVNKRNKRQQEQLLLEIGGTQIPHYEMQGRTEIEPKSQNQRRSYVR